MKINTPYRLLTAIILMTLVYSCSAKKEAPLTQAEVQEFGKQFEKAVNIKDASFLNSALHTETFLSKIDRPSSVSKKEMTNALEDKMRLGDILLRDLTDKAQYSMIRQYEKSGVQHILFRLYDEGGLNYHDMEMVRAEGKPRIGDFYIYLTGENMSATINSLFGQFMKQMGKNVSDEKAEAFIKHVQQLRSLVSQKQFEEAKRLYTTLPPNFKKEKAFQLINIQINSELGDEAYQAALTEYDNLYPNDPSKHLMMIDAYFLRNDFTKALDAINQLDKSVGTDPLLDYHRSLCYTAMKDDAKSLEHLQKLVKNMPDFEDGKAELIATYLGKDEYAKATPLIEDFRNRKEFNQGTLSMLLSAYPGYDAAMEKNK